MIINWGHWRDGFTIHGIGIVNQWVSAQSVGPLVAELIVGTVVSLNANRSITSLNPVRAVQAIAPEV